MKIRNVDLGEFPVLLAPLEDITDVSYRLICKEQGADMVYTEFVSSDGLIRDAHKSLRKLVTLEGERPVGIQIFGADLDAMVEAAKYAQSANPDVIDINWGCPVKKVVTKGAGSGILKDIPKMIKITEAVVKAVDLPVTVKTRLGWDESNKPIVEVAERLQDVGIEALTIHGRTRSQLYSGVADWTLIGKVKENPKMRIPVIGNGDLCTPDQVILAKNRYGVDGVMIGRAAIGNPWIFASIKQFIMDGSLLPEPTLRIRAATALRHLETAVNYKGERTALVEMRKFYSGYFKGIPHFKSYKMQLMTSLDLMEIKAILNDLLNQDS